MFTNFPDRLEQVLGKGNAIGKSVAKEASEAHEACRAGL